MNTVYLLLGSNMGNSNQLLNVAKKQISKKIGAVTRQSSVYQTTAWGNIKQADFLNQVIIISTKLSAEEVLKIALQIEESLGRIRSVKNAPRTIDIDILFYNKAIINQPSLQIPHPQIQNRKFVLTPLNELSPNLKHPVFNKSIHQLLTICIDTLNVKKK